MDADRLSLRLDLHSLKEPLRSGLLGTDSDDALYLLLLGYNTLSLGFPPHITSARLV